MTELRKIYNHLRNNKKVTYEELNDLLPEDMILEEQIEKIIHYCEQHNIQLLSQHSLNYKTNNDYNKDIVIDNLIDTPEKFYFYELNKNEKIAADTIEETVLFDKLSRIKNKIINLLLETDYFLFELFKDFTINKNNKQINFLYVTSKKSIEENQKKIKDAFKKYANDKKHKENKLHLISIIQSMHIKFNYIINKINQLKIISLELKKNKLTEKEMLLQNLKRKKINSKMIDKILPELKYLINKYNKTKQKLINRFLPQVISLAKHYHNESMNYNDLIQEGNMAMLEALDIYSEVEHKKKFFHFASSFIRKKIKNYMENNYSLIKRSKNFKKDCKEYLKISKDFKKTYSRQPTFEEIKKHLQWPDKKIQHVIYYLQREESIEKEDPETSLSLRDALFSKKERLPDEIVIDEILKESILTIIQTLPQKEQHIIKMRFGFNEENKIIEYKKIAEEFQASINEIKNLEDHILKKLRVLFKENHLEEFI
jgi:RNA polymerase sigma factor (sigma-70 family)